MIISNHNYVPTFLLLSIPLLLCFGHVIGQRSSELNGVGIIRCFEKERQALLKFKQEIVDEHGRLSTWGIEENKRDCCRWIGVYCHNQTNHVTRLDLRAPLEDAPLQGKISNSLLELQQLTYLDLSLNNFDRAPIPEFIGSIRKLRYLNLSYALFSGPIPRHIGNLSKLHYLSLENSQLYSKDLEWLSRLHDLRYLNLNSVNLSMATNWLQAISELNSIKELRLTNTHPPEIFPSSFPYINTSASTLAVLHLSRNSHISSSTFHWFLNFSSGLTHIYLYDSKMNGNIPNALDNMMSLEHLDLSHNSLQGGIPKSFGNMMSLAHLDLSENSLEGGIPKSFGNMMSLAHLDLSDNSLEGGIPNSFGNMSSLIHLDLSRNRLSGQLSELMMNLSGRIERKLQYLDLTLNSISGSFPDVVRLSSLNTLQLRGNQLKGCILEKCLQLPNLLVLDLSLNNLMGPLPDFSFCSSMKELNLQDNKFNGTFSKSIGGLSKLKHLYLGSNLLEGIITEDHLFNLSRLQILDLSSNSLLKLKFSHQWVPPFQLEMARLSSCELGPQFPKWIRHQKMLTYLDISNARISDSIPTWFGYIHAKLILLNASNNQIIGSFPKITHNWTRPTYVSLWPFQTLDLSKNNISGSVTFLCDIPSFSVIDLSDNRLSDKLPECFANFVGLKYLILANNNLSGKIPDSFGSLSALTSLNFRNNSFSGGIPTSMKYCTKLRMIDLGENKLTGKIPSWMGDGFPYLALLSLRSNKYFGSIPTSICGLQTLQILDLSSNNISGPIPKCLSSLTAMTSAYKAVQDGPFNTRYPTVVLLPPVNNPYALDDAKFTWKGTEIKYIKNLELVKLVDLSNNNLAGDIPAEITKLDELIGLNLSRNNLIGSIPQTIGELKTLNFLDLSRNQLSGGIPTSLSELSHLGILNLSNNNLSGRIPQNSHMLTFEESDYAGNPGLCGRPLNKSCPGDDETDQNSNFNPKHEEEADDKLISQGFYIALGGGFVIGFWGIFGTILFNKSVRFAFLKVLNRIEDCVYLRVALSKSRLQRHFQN